MYNIYSHSNGTGCTTVAIALACLGNARLVVEGNNHDDVYVYSGRVQDAHSVYDFGWAQDFSERRMRDRGAYGIYECDSLDTNVLVVTNSYLSLKRALHGEEQRAEVRRAPDFVVCSMEDHRALNDRDVQDVLQSIVGEHARFLFLTREHSIARRADAGLLSEPKRFTDHMSSRLQPIVNAMLLQPLL